MTGFSAFLYAWYTHFLYTLYLFITVGIIQPLAFRARGICQNKRTSVPKWLKHSL